jgi:hypothetical protein
MVLLRSQEASGAHLQSPPSLGPAGAFRQPMADVTKLVSPSPTLNTTASWLGFAATTAVASGACLLASSAYP